MSGLLGFPAAAHAARVTFDLTAGEGAEDEVVFRAAPGERNRVRVRLNRPKRSMTIVDTGVARISVERARFPTCRSGGARRVVCRLAAVVLRAGNGDDRVEFVGGGAAPAPPVTDPVRFLDLVVAREDARANGAIPEATDVAGGRGNDTIIGSDGDDVIAPGPGRDPVDARAGDDVVVETPDGVNDSIRCGAGIDGLEFEGGRPVKVDLAAGTMRAPVERDPVRGFEEVSSGSSDDTPLGDGNANALAGQGGADVIDGRGGNDVVAEAASCSSHAQIEPTGWPAVRATTWSARRAPRLRARARSIPVPARTASPPTSVAVSSVASSRPCAS